MAEMTPQRWARTSQYLQEVFGRQDDVLAALMPQAVAAGVPDIAVSADVGRMLMILASMTNGGRGARLALELGTLAGYSAIWIARGLAPDGRLITLEPAAAHATIARQAFADAGLAGRIELRETTALAELPRLTAEFGPASFDLIFMDAIKAEYPAYFVAARPLLRVGGLLLADNVLGSRSWWIDDEPGGPHEADRSAVDRFNRAVAADPDYEAVAVPIREGVLVARRVR